MLMHHVFENEIIRYMFYVKDIFTELPKELFYVIINKYVDALNCNYIFCGNGNLFLKDGNGEILMLDNYKKFSKLSTKIDNIYCSDNFVCVDYNKKNFTVIPGTELESDKWRENKIGNNIRARSNLYYTTDDGVFEYNYYGIKKKLIDGKVDFYCCNDGYVVYVRKGTCYLLYRYSKMLVKLQAVHGSIVHILLQYNKFMIISEERGNYFIADYDIMQGVERSIVIEVFFKSIVKACCTDSAYFILAYDYNDLIGLYVKGWYQMQDFLVFTRLSIDDVVDICCSNAAYFILTKDKLHGKWEHDTTTIENFNTRLLWPNFF